MRFGLDLTVHVSQAGLKLTIYLLSLLNPGIEAMHLCAQFQNLNYSLYPLTHSALPTPHVALAYLAPWL